MGKNDKPQKKPGENRKTLLNALEAWKRPRVDVKDPKAIEARIEEYLQYCVENDVAPGVAGCASWLGVAYRTLEGWYTGYRGSPEHQRVASRLYGVLQNVWEQDMHEGNINNIGGIFTSKVFFGFRDTQEVVINQTVKNELSVQDLIAESKRLPGSETMALPQNGTIDADYKVLEDDFGYNRAAARAEAQAERKAKSEALKPIREQKRKDYHKEYYQEHKEDYAESKRRNAERRQNGDTAPRKRGRPPMKRDN